MQFRNAESIQTEGKPAKWSGALLQQDKGAAHLEDATGLLVDEARDTLDTAAARKAPDGGLGNALDVVPQDLAVPLGTALAEALAALAASRHLVGGCELVASVTEAWQFPESLLWLSNWAKFGPESSAAGAWRFGKPFATGKKSNNASPQKFIQPLQNPRAKLLHPVQTDNCYHGSYKADRSQVHGWQGAPQAAGHQGSSQVRAGHR